MAVEGSLAGASRIFSGIRMDCRICVRIGLWGAETGATGSEALESWPKARQAASTSWRRRWASSAAACGTG